MGALLATRSDSVRWDRADVGGERYGRLRFFERVGLDPSRDIDEVLAVGEKARPHVLVGSPGRIQGGGCDRGPSARRYLEQGSRHGRREHDDASAAPGSPTRIWRVADHLDVSSIRSNPFHL